MLRLEHPSIAELMSAGQAISAPDPIASAPLQDDDLGGGSDICRLTVPVHMAVIIALHAELGRRAERGGTYAAAAMLAKIPASTLVRQ